MFECPGVDISAFFSARNGGLSCGSASRLASLSAILATLRNSLKLIRVPVTIKPWMIRCISISDWFLLTVKIMSESISEKDFMVLAIGWVLVVNVALVARSGRS